MHTHKGMATTGITAVIALAVIVGGIVYFNSRPDDQIAQEMGEQMMDKGEAMMKEGEEMMEKAKALIGSYAYAGELVDVTDGQTVRGITTEGNASGFAEADIVDGAYKLVATFANIPDPQGDDFYEGWIVRQDPFNVISTGRVNKDGSGIYMNIYASETDLTDHDFYVLTLEPNDNDPAPADHIVEGTLLRTDGDAEGAMTGEAMEKKDTDGAMEKEDEGAMMEKENKLVFTGELLAGSKDASPLLEWNQADYDQAVASDKLVMLYFFASWCQLCSVEFNGATTDAFNALEGDDVVGFRVHFRDNETTDAHENLAREYNVIGQHTKVFIKNGQEVLKNRSTWNDADRYLQEFAAAL